MEKEKRSDIGIGKFTRKILALFDDEFEAAMRSESEDKNATKINEQNDSQPS
jgi:hypothetical protein